MTNNQTAITSFFKPSKNNYNRISRNQHTFPLIRQHQQLQVQNSPTEENQHRPRLITLQQDIRQPNNLTQNHSLINQNTPSFQPQQRPQSTNNRLLLSTASISHQEPTTSLNTIDRSPKSPVIQHIEPRSSASDINNIQVNPTNTESTNNTSYSHHHTSPHHPITSTTRPDTSDFIGLPPSNHKPENTFRLYYTNPNGLHIDRLWQCDYDDHCREINLLSADICAFLEINLDTKKHHVKDILHFCSKQSFSQYQITMSSSTIQSVNMFKPGGTMLLTTGSMTGRIISSADNPLGRWCHQTLVQRNKQFLTIISLYKTNRQSPVNHSGQIRSLTATAQQSSILRQQGRTEHPHHAFFQDFNNFLSQTCFKNNSFLIVGDFNTTIEKSPEIHLLMQKFNLVDLLHNHLQTTNFATHINRSERIDFILCSRNIQNSLQNACYELFKYRSKGDHPNIIIDFDYQTLFGHPNYRIETPTQRSFHTIC